MLSVPLNEYYLICASHVLHQFDYDCSEWKAFHYSNKAMLLLQVFLDETPSTEPRHLCQVNTHQGLFQGRSHFVQNLCCVNHLVVSFLQRMLGFLHLTHCDKWLAVHKFIALSSQNCLLTRSHNGLTVSWPATQLNLFCWRHFV